MLHCSGGKFTPLENSRYLWECSILIESCFLRSEIHQKCVVENNWILVIHFLKDRKLSVLCHDHTWITNICNSEDTKYENKSSLVHLLVNSNNKTARLESPTELSPLQISFQGFSGVLSGCWPLNNHMVDCVNGGAMENAEALGSLLERERMRQHYLVHALQNPQNVFESRAVRERLKPGQATGQGKLPHVDMSLHDGGVLWVPPIHCNSTKHNIQALKVSATQDCDENDSLQLTK